MLVTKDKVIKARVTAEMQEAIFNYCRTHNMTVSEFVRYACNEVFAATGSNIDMELVRARVEKVKALIEKSKSLHS